MLKRHVFISKLTRRFSLRLHMTLILLATAMAGAAASKLFLMAGLGNPAIRYPLTVIFAYVIFFIAIKFWLWIIVGSTAVQTRLSGQSLPDLSSASLPESGGSSPSGTSFSGGGGTFSGAGASGSYGDAVSSLKSSGGSSSGGGGSASFDLDLDDGIGIIIVLIALALLLAAIFGAGAYLIYQAPSILSEVAFDSVLAMSLTRKSRTMLDPEWIGSVFKATWKEFTVILAVTTVTGTVIHLIFPAVTKLSGFITILMKHL